MANRPTSQRPETRFDDLRRQAVLDPGHSPAYGQLAAQHFGAFDVDRLRPLLRRVELLHGKSPTGKRLDGLFRRIEAAHAVRRRLLGAPPAKSHTVRIAGRRIHFVADDPAAERFVTVNLVGQWPYEVGVMRYLLRRLAPDDVFVDVGAHAGFFSLIANSIGAVAYAIEPQRDLVRVIERNAVLNGADRLHALTLAVSDREGLTSIIRLGGSPGMQLHGELTKSGHATAQNRHVDWVPIMRLDSLFAEPAVQPRVVKIDVEGHEIRALAGAERLIAAQHAAFVVELHPHLVTEYGDEMGRIHDFFGTPDWRVLDASADPPVPTSLADGLEHAGRPGHDGRVTLAFEPASWPAY